jgi:hypothetical protein
MKTLRIKLTLKNIISTSITVLFTTLFVWWGMHFPGPMPPSAKADTFAVNCQTTPTPDSDYGWHPVAVSNLFSQSNS